MRLLFVKLGPYFAPTEVPIAAKYEKLSVRYNGDIIAVVNDKKYCGYKIHKFKLQGLYLSKYIRHNTLLRDICFVPYAIIQASVHHYFKEKYYAVIAYDPLITGLTSYIISKITGAKLIVEVNGNYNSAFRLSYEKLSLVVKIKEKLVNILLPFIINRAAAVKLLYKSQLEPFSGIKNDRIKIFHDFVPVSKISPTERSYNYIYFLGYPWYLKGVDILIQSFNRISVDYPHISLKIMGYCPDKAYFIKLAKGNDNIELLDPLWHKQAMDMLRGCCMFVLPSRTEAMGRVLLEAMACRKPIIASNVDGIPSYIKDGYNGLLFDSENIEDLAKKLKLVLDDGKLASSLAENGYEYVHQVLSEDSYLNNYEEMLQETRFY